MSIARFLFFGRVNDFLRAEADDDVIVISDDEGYTSRADELHIREEKPPSDTIIISDSQEEPAQPLKKLKPLTKTESGIIKTKVEKKKQELKKYYDESISEQGPRKPELGRPFTPAENDRINEIFKIGRERKLIEYTAQKAYPDQKSHNNENFLTSDQLQFVNTIHAARGIDGSLYIQKKFNITIYYTDIVKLLPYLWLNDAVINYFLKLVVERSEHNHQLMQPKADILRVWSFTSYFYPVLRSGGYDKVKKYTKEKNCSGGIFKRDLIFVPLHIQNSHWAAGVINFKKRRLEYYDSMLESEKDNFAIRMIAYLKKEHAREKLRDPGIQDYNFNEWTVYTLPKITKRGKGVIYVCPQQSNSCDCGEFTCRFFEYLSRGADFDFETKDMIYFRRRHALEIIQNRLFDF